MAISSHFSNLLPSRSFDTSSTSVRFARAYRSPVSFTLKVITNQRNEIINGGENAIFNCKSEWRQVG
jgi:hypothetical protein